jgi:uncharacterized protein YegJ (DUF2314 family)
MNAHHQDSSDHKPSATKSDGEPVFMAVRDSDIVETTQEAQGSLSSFRKAVETDGYPNALMSVKALICEANSSDGAHLWLGIKQLDEDGFFCYPFEIPTGFQGLKLGEYVFIPNEAIEDWMLNDQGTVYGGYSLRLQRSMTPERLRSDFDRHTGIASFADTLP